MFFAPTLRTRAYAPAARAFDGSFERFLNESFIRPTAGGLKVEQDDKAWTVSLDLPGVAREQLAVNIEGAVVRIETAADAKRQFKAAYELPEGYLPAGPSLAEMGRHSSPRSILSVAKLSTVMIAGYLPDGSQMHFLEPMISQETLLSQQDFSLDVPMLTTFGREMLYPTTFEATFQGNSWSFVFTDFVSVQ